MKKAEAGAAEGKVSSFGTGSRTEPEPSEPAAAVSDSVPLRAGQTNPIKARNRSPSTSPVHEAQSDNSSFVRWQKTVRSQTGRSRSEADRTGPDRKADISGIGPEIQRQFELQLDHSRGTGQWKEIKVRDSNQTQEALQTAKGPETGSAGASHRKTASQYELLPAAGSPAFRGRSTGSEHLPRR